MFDLFEKEKIQKDNDVYLDPSSLLIEVYSVKKLKKILEEEKIEDNHVNIINISKI